MLKHSSVSTEIFTTSQELDLRKSHLHVRKGTGTTNKILQYSCSNLLPLELPFQYEERSISALLNKYDHLKPCELISTSEFKKALLKRDAN